MGTALPSATSEAVGAENISHSGKDKYAASLALFVVAKQVPLSGNTREMPRLNQPFFMRFRIKLLILKLHEPFVLERFCQVCKIVASGRYAPKCGNEIPESKSSQLILTLAPELVVAARSF
jgi:hypothetical protein